ncbi:rod-binding protein [Massilia yuzhufengensis]|uniref:Flagellar protein FlgJ n=1 Tax=Massilia yuzhufengensis TaxID=1164594 RepID=A0A1I1G1P2_9BURK|nr:rod-binding protein [Massilia yuzhufengensis]SFC05202.1 flagellar protein FlgJ [Massilia yuzhufengensis]
MKIEQQQAMLLKPELDAPVAAAAQPAVDPVYVAKATKAAVEFERFFVSHMLKEMRNSTRAMATEDSVFNNKVNQDMQDMADDLLAGNMAGNRAFGIADAILRQLVPTAKPGTKA